MKTKFLVLVVLVVSSIQAQTTENELWSSFQIELDKIIQIQTENENMVHETDYKQCYRNGFINLLLNTSIERKGLDYIAQRYGRDSLVLVREFASFVFDEIARSSKDSFCRRAAINYLLDYSINPPINRLLLTDFDEEAKQKIVKIIRQQYTEEEINFYAITQVRYNMKKLKNWYDDYYIPDYLKEQKQKNKKKVSYEEIWEHLYQTKLLKEKENIVNFPVANADLRYLRNMILNAGLLNIREAIPCLKEYANSDALDDDTRMDAVCALAAMRVEDYEERAVAYFDVDTGGDTWLAEMINSQKIWYTYLRGLKSEKYDGKCPVAYRIIDCLGDFLKDFPKTDRPWFEGWEELTDGMRVLIPSKTKPVPLVPDECRISTPGGRVPINPDHIKIVVDWMESHKGKYELQEKIDKTF